MSESPTVFEGIPDEIEIVIPFGGTREEVTEWIDKNLPGDFPVRIHTRAQTGWYR